MASALSVNLQHVWSVETWEYADLLRGHDCCVSFGLVTKGTCWIELFIHLFIWEGGFLNFGSYLIMAP